MRDPWNALRYQWNALRCQLRGHRWQTVEDGGDRGWKCRCCETLVLERELLERVHDPDATDHPVMAYGGAAGGSSPPF